MSEALKAGFVSSDNVARHTPGFAGTVIEVKLYEPGLPDLTLLDLPGILNSGVAKDFVKGLIQQHISCKCVWTRFLTLTS